jgi:CheY-like chemotaxis protein
MLNKVRILCIDDNPDFLETLSFWLNSKNYEAIMASNAIYGIELLKKGLADIILVDYKMPAMDGILAIKEIRDIDQRIPIVIMTAYADDKLIDELAQLSVTGFISKLGSFNNELEDLLKKITNDLKKNKPGP